MGTSAHQQEPTRQTWDPPLPAAGHFEHQLVATPGLRTHVATVGQGEPVLLLHGFPQHWWQWRTVAPRIAARGYRVICPDLRGQGWTRAREPGIGRLQMRDDVLELLDALGVDRAHVVGHDLGAVVAGQLAYQHPQRVRSLALLSVPPGFMSFSPRLLPAFKHMPPLLMHRDGRSLAWLFGPDYAARPLPEDVLDAYLRVNRCPGYDRDVRTLYRSIIIPEALRLATGHYRRRRLHPSTLAVFGRQDGPFSESTVRRICRSPERHAEHFELGFVPDAAHFIVDDAPDAVAGRIIDWIGRAG